MIIDCHHHWMPKEHIEELERYLRPNEEVIRENGKARILRDGTEVFVPNPSYWDIEAHLAAMDEAGVDMAVLSTSVWQEWNTMEIAPVINNSLAEIQKKYPARFIGLAHIPSFEEGAIEELDRAVRVLGLKGVLIMTNTQGKYPDDDAYRPLYQKAVELDVPVVVHAAGALPDHKFLSEYQLSRVFGRPIDHTLVVLRLLLSGILKDFPALKFINGHLGGTWFALKERFRSSPFPLQLDDISLNQLYFDTAGAKWGKAELTCAAQTLGVDNIVLGSDYPVGRGDQMKWEVELLKGLGLSEADREKIASGNARKLFKI